MAMSNLIYSLLAILNLGILYGVQSAPYAVTIGGSADLKSIIDVQVGTQSHVSYSGGAYIRSTSLGGVSKFKFESYDILVSTVPFTAAQEIGYANQKLTIPLAVSTLSPFHSTVSGVRLTAAQIASILRGTLQNWVAPASGPITPVLRADPSGFVEVFTRFLSKAVPLWPSIYVGDGPFTFGNSRAITASGSAGVANLLAQTPGGFGFGLSRVYSKAPYNLKEIAVRNRAGRYVTIAGSNAADILAALPATPPNARAILPPYGLTWSPAGPQTYPITYLAYVFYKAKYSSLTKRNRIIQFGSYTLSPAGQALLIWYRFQPLPSSYRVTGIAALHTITVG